MNSREAVTIDRKACTDALAATAHINEPDARALLDYVFSEKRREDGRWSVTDFCAATGRKWQTLNSRFHRAGALSPKHFSGLALSIRATALAAGGLSSPDAAGMLRCSSSQSLGRTMRIYLGCKWREARADGVSAKAIQLLVDGLEQAHRPMALARCPHCGKLATDEARKVGATT